MLESWTGVPLFGNIEQEDQMTSVCAIALMLFVSPGDFNKGWKDDHGTPGRNELTMAPSKFAHLRNDCRKASRGTNDAIN
jgi:hypothetical protein